MERAFYETGGTSVAGPGSMARRLTAFAGIIAFILVVLLLMWQVYLHHQTGAVPEEPTIVGLAARRA